jgi:ribonucleoside-diphosphate reductase alpha chain
MDNGLTAARQQEQTTQTTMRVTKRNGHHEPVDINKIVRAISRCTPSLPNVDVMRIATKTISGLYDGATTKELDKLSIQTAASLIFEEPEYSKLAARLLNQYIEKEVRNQEIPRAEMNCSNSSGSAPSTTVIY